MIDVLSISRGILQIYSLYMYFVSSHQWPIHFFFFQKMSSLVLMWCGSRQFKSSRPQGVLIRDLSLEREPTAKSTWLRCMDRSLPWKSSTRWVVAKKLSGAFWYFIRQLIIRSWEKPAILVVNSSPPGLNGCHFTDDMFKHIFLTENIWISR